MPGGIMNKLPIIAVIGSTGAQGGGLVRAIIADKERKFTVRALTRKADGPAARELAALGAEVVAGDLDDTATLERAFAGAQNLYAVTNFWEHFSPERELAQAASIARAAKTAGIRHMIWSTLEDTRTFIPLSDDRMPTLMGKYKVNIASMSLSRDAAGGEALTVLNLDSVPPISLLDEIRKDPDISNVRVVKL